MIQGVIGTYLQYFIYVGILTCFGVRPLVAPPKGIVPMEAESRSASQRTDTCLGKQGINGQQRNRAGMDIYNMVVAKDGTGDFTTLQEAINSAKAFPGQRVTIKVKKGLYKEKIEVYQWNDRMSIIGEDREQTIITYDDHFDKLDLGRNSTFHTPTFLVQGNDFYMANLTIANTAGQVGQAIALSINADRVKVENCTIIGNQDTLYTTGEGFKQYFKDCSISGTTDFIFGQATVFFEDCTLHSRSNSFITAASTPEHSAFGFVFMNCTLTAERGVDRVYLGRPWRTHAKTVFINCFMGKHIAPEGWDNWSNTEAETKSFYGEYTNRGPGFQPEKRAAWSHQLKDSEAREYTKVDVLSDTTANHQDWYLRTN